MSRMSEEEIQAIMEEYKDAPMVNPNKTYPPLPPAGNIKPLVRVPEQMSFTEKIGGTEYTVNAHFRKDGRDLLAMLSDIFMRDILEYGIYGETDWDGDDGE
ncbi:MAG: transposon-encoded TnpW family protein [Bacteroides sp.]|nr:transposon-encoded TnpW family protein [Bacteroides sp.]MCM1548750.1 transposon-encoded TnpW family protein [Clostridium sp.]